MKDTNQLPPHTITIHDHPEPHIMQWSDLELAAVKRYAEQYALQARAQVQGEPIGEVGTMPGTSGFTMACFRADEVPVGTKLYTSPQPATGEPVVDVRCEGCGYMTHHREHMGCVRAAKQHTHPATSVPDDDFDLICNAIDKADTITMEGDYMLDSDDCIAVVRVMQVLLSVRAAMLADKQKGGA